ncbi:jg15259 [Pararge aegeria aegeria]|uniref:Jg15259 protein n=1 Tax=Pararge aegeria aegeria TaxID=348720 RepID=A0A8S4SHG9_9NEOP|nr:jg15259 [Pararge aegeria aegeria]
MFTFIRSISCLLIYNVDILQTSKVLRRPILERTSHLAVINHFPLMFIYKILAASRDLAVAKLFVTELSRPLEPTMTVTAQRFSDQVWGIQRRHQLVDRYCTDRRFSQKSSREMLRPTP